MRRNSPRQHHTLAKKNNATPISARNQTQKQKRRLKKQTTKSFCRFLWVGVGGVGWEEASRWSRRGGSGSHPTSGFGKAEAGRSVGGPQPLTQGRTGQEDAAGVTGVRRRHHHHQPFSVSRRRRRRRRRRRHVPFFFFIKFLPGSG